MDLQHERSPALATPGFGKDDLAGGSISNVDSKPQRPPQLRCENCGSPLPARRKLKTFCSYACRGQHKALEATTHRTGLKCSKNVKQNKALRSLKRQSVAGFAFSRINSCAYRLDRPGKLGTGWLMEVAWPGGARQRWIARVRNQASEGLSLDEAKRAAVSMLCERAKAEPRDWIGDLNKIAAAEVDRAARAQDIKLWPIDILGGGNRRRHLDAGLRAAILDAELSPPQSDEPPLQGDDYPLEHYEDGFPKLPACLDRRGRP